MRHFFIAVMIILLPLRGWAGQVMAVDMAVQQVMTAAAPVVEDAGLVTAMPPDCPMLAQSTGMVDAESIGASVSSHHCNNCNNCDTCQLCLTLASVPHSVTPGPGFIPWVKSQSAFTRFLSANVAPDQKPPIS